MGVMNRNIEPHTTLPAFRSAAASVAVIAPSLLITLYLMDHPVPLQSPYATSCLILLLAVADFIVSLYLEPRRRHLSALTLPALVAAMTVVFLFVFLDTLQRFSEGLGYGLLTPFVAVSVIMLYAAAFMEKNLVLKIFFCLNSLGLLLLWVMGAADRVTMPF